MFDTVEPGFLPSHESPGIEFGRQGGILRRQRLKFVESVGVADHPRNQRQKAGECQQSSGEHKTLEFALAEKPATEQETGGDQQERTLWPEQRSYPNNKSSESTELPVVPIRYLQRGIGTLISTDPERKQQENC